MKKLFVSLCLTAAAATVLASGSSVTGFGGFRDVNEGVATFRLDFSEDALRSHQFVFAAEGVHKDYPDTVFKSMGVSSYMQMGNAVMITGTGLIYNETLVNYMLIVRDNGPRQRDYMEFHAFVDPQFHIIHFAQFLTAGDIVINPGK